MLPLIVMGVTFGLSFGWSATEWASRQIRGRVTRRRPARPSGKLRTVRGIARGRQTLSPFERVPCLFTWLRLVAEPDPFRRVERQLAVGSDFLLESPEGRFTVRIEGLCLRGKRRFPEPQPVATTPEDAVARVIESAGLESPYFAELHVRAGDEIEVTGVCRLEPALQNEAAGGMRSDALAPALSGGGGRLDVRFIS